GSRRRWMSVQAIEAPAPIGPAQLSISLDQVQQVIEAALLWCPGSALGDRIVEHCPVVPEPLDAPERLLRRLGQLAVVEFQPVAELPVEVEVPAASEPGALVRGAEGGGPGRGLGVEGCDRVPLGHGLALVV